MNSSEAPLSDQLPKLPDFPSSSLAESTLQGSSRRRGPGWFLIILLAIPLGLIALAGGLSRIEPSFYRERCQQDDPKATKQFSNQFLQQASRLINDVQNSPAWSSEFSEQQINGWLSDDFEQNHAAKVLPAGVEMPRVQVTGDHFRLAFRCQRGFVSTVIQIGARAWVPRRNLLAIELETAHAGMLPLPTTYTRTVIEQFVVERGLDISWKRQGRSLVALIDFARSERQIVLRRVEVKDGKLMIEGLSGRYAIPSADYAPTAN